MTQTAPAAPCDCQADVMAFLARGGLEGGGLGGKKPKRIDTHSASIFLTPERAWKIKRAVRFGYLDFTTADARRQVLQDELRLNRLTAPELYIAVHPVTRDAAGQLAIDGAGEAVDWLLEMQRFPDGALLSEQVAAGTLDPAMLMRLADRIQAFHAGCELVLSPHGAEDFGQVLEGNVASMAAYPAILPPDDVAAWVAASRAMLAYCTPQFDARARLGRVRHGHGDLHLANIALVDGEPLLFDCLEFSAELATVDILYDLAFLLMDLWQRGLHHEANIVFNRYLDLSPGDEDALALMPLFLSMRAAIRAHVMAAQSEMHGRDAGLAAQARAYLQLALELLVPVQPRLVAVGGLSGSGKSTLARAIGHALGRAPGARILRSDVLRKRIAGVAPETRLPRESYGKQSSHAVYALLQQLAGQALAQGQAAIADAVFADPAERSAIAQVASEAVCPFDGIWLEASDRDRSSRIAARPPDASDADVALVAVQSGFDLGDLGDWHRLAARGPVQDMAKAALAVLHGD